MPNSTSSDIFNVLSTIAPNAMPITYEDGKIAGTSQYRQNPYGMISHTGYRKDRNKVLQVKAQAKQKLDIVTKGLGVRAMVAFDGVSGYGTGKTSNYATYELQRITHTLCMEKTNNCHWLKRNYTIIININWPLMQVSLMTYFWKTRSLCRCPLLSVSIICTG